MYRVVIADNFHFSDRREEYVIGEFESYNGASDFCRRRVEAEIDDFIHQGIKIEKLLETWRLYGETPIIEVSALDDSQPQKTVGHVPFSADEYAIQYIAQCAKSGTINNPDIEANGIKHSQNAPEEFHNFHRRFSKIRNVKVSPKKEEAVISIKEQIRRDFGISINIELGSGRKHDPFVIPKCSIYEAQKNQMLLLRGICKGRSELWSFEDRRVEIIDGKELQAFRVKTVRLLPTEIVRETRSYFFDVSEVESGDFAGMPMAWLHEESGFMAPMQLGWLHFDEVVRQEADYGAVLYYSAIQSKLSLSIYKPADLSEPSIINKELSRAEMALRAVQPNAEAPWDALDYGVFRSRWFLVGSDTSLVGIALKNGHVLKVRQTFHDEPVMRELMQESMVTLNQYLYHT